MEQSQHSLSGARYSHFIRGTQRLSLASTTHVEIEEIKKSGIGKEVRTDEREKKNLLGLAVTDSQKVTMMERSTVKTLTLHITCKWKVKVKVAQLSNSLRPRGLYSPWNSPGQNTRVGNLSLLQGIFPTQGSNPGLPHCRWILHQLSYQGSPITCK